MPDPMPAEGDVWVIHPLNVHALTDPPLALSYLAACCENMDHTLQCRADRQCVTFDPDKVQWETIGSLADGNLCLMAHVPAMTFTCVDCGRKTQDPDRWDPDAVTGEIRCDPCWYARDLVRGGNRWPT